MNQKTLENAVGKKGNVGGYECRRGPGYITMQQPFDCCGAYGSSRLSTCRRWISSTPRSQSGGGAYRSPSRRYHEILGLLVREVDQAGRPLLATSATARHGRWRDLLLRGLRHRYPGAVEILLQPRVQLRQPPQLELGHALLLRLAVANIAGLVWG